MNTIKTALSFPKDQFLRLEKVRKKKGLSRSAFFQKLAASYLRVEEEKNRVRDYVEGYGRSPEETEEYEALAQAAAEAFKEEDLV